LNLNNKNILSNNGLVIVYTGKGKGKTTAALGLSLRAIGYNWRVCMIQFIKGSWHSGEIEGINRLAPNFELVIAGGGFIGILDDKKSIGEHQNIAKKALDISRKKVSSGNYELVILDEINYAVALNLINLKDIIELIKIRPKHMTLVLTGNKAHKRVIQIADLVTEMKEIKHPYKKGTIGAKGIDY
jgi:cob(I)alamin adenosyltransferase